jgi:oligopeptide transport system permease protein
LLVIVTAAFFLMRLAPGGPFDDERTLPPEVAANLEAAYGLDQPILVQNELSGSRRRSRAVVRYKDFGCRADRAGSGHGGPGRCACARGDQVALVLPGDRNRTGSPGRAAPVGIAVHGRAGPGASFGVARLVPVGGRERAICAAPCQSYARAAIVAHIARLTRGSLLVLSSHIRTARRRESQILYGTRSSPPSCRVSGRGALLTGSLVVEQVFGLPGVGRYFVQGAVNRDYTLVMGMVVFYALLIVLLNLVVDLVYGWLDPRIRHD